MTDRSSELDREVPMEGEGGLETQGEAGRQGSAAPGGSEASGGSASQGAAPLAPGPDTRPEARPDALPGVQPDALPVIQPGAGRSRREVLKLMALAAAAPATFSACAPEGDSGSGGTGQGADAGGGAGAAPELPSGASPTPGATNPLARGDAWDPDLLSPVLRWEKVLTDDELEGLAALCDVIVPADDVSPSASAVGCQHFVDEWVSAPYGFSRDDLVLVRGGLAWLDAESADRFGAGKRFRDLAENEKTAICDDICHQPDAAPEHRMAARFFHKVRDLTLTAFYTTDEGMADIGYVGNVPRTTWELPPPEVLRHLGLEGEV